MSSSAAKVQRPRPWVPLHMKQKKTKRLPPKNFSCWIEKFCVLFFFGWNFTENWEKRKIVIESNAAFSATFSSSSVRRRLSFAAAALSQRETLSKQQRQQQKQISERLRKETIKAHNLALEKVFSPLSLPQVRQDSLSLCLLVLFLIH